MTGITHPAVIVEPSAWLRTAAADRTRRVRALGVDPHGAGPLVLTSLTDPQAGDRSRWDFTCDRCGVYCAGKAWFVGRYQAARALVVTFGLCETCAQREVLA